MQIDTATLLALVATPTAVLALVSALAVAMLARRGRRTLGGATSRLDAREANVREELVGARVSLERLRVAAASLRSQGPRFDKDLATWTVAIADQRLAVERLRRGRLGPAVRAMQVAGALARVALLWRMPAR